MNLCEARRVYAGNRKTPRHRALPAAGGVRHQREAWVQSSPPGAPGVNWAQRPAASLSLSLRHGGLPKAHPPLGGFPPIRGGLTSDPARYKVFQLEAARGWGRGAPPARSRVGAHSACAGHGPQQGRAREDSLRLRALAGGSPNPVSVPCRACGGPPLPSGPPAADSTPPADLKGEAGRRGDGVPWGEVRPPGGIP